MFKSLEISNGVKHKHSIFDFKEGVTCIHGSNGAGKSLVQEYIRFCLFGTNALRGTVKENPQDLWCSLKFNIKNDSYTLDRGLKNAILTRENGERIEGTTAVNKKIVEILGYGLSVFDMGNCSKQGEISALGRMKPSERKAAIDQVIGMNAVSDLLKEIRQEKKETSSFLEGLKYGLVEPTPPEKPEFYREVSSITLALEEKRRLKREYDILKNRCDSLQCPVPVWEGEVPQGDLSSEAYHKKLLSDKEKISNLRCDSKWTKEELARWRELSIPWESYTKPKISEERADEIISHWDKYNLWKKSEKATCPKCGTLFATSGAEEVREPKIGLNWAKEQKRLNLIAPKGEKPAVLLNSVDYLYEMTAISNKERLVEIEEEIKKLGDVDYDKLKAYKKFKEDVVKHNEYLNELTKLNSMSKIDTSEIEQLEFEKLHCLMYETSLKNYNENIKSYNEKLEKIKELEDKLEEFSKEIESLEKFKTQVKLQVTPSLTKIATNLAREMTDGEITDVVIDEDFNILVNNRELRTFSGSEEAVANLAIRLALSCVLTRKVLNIFMGDEIDAAMDDDRANRVCESLIKLKNDIDQIILISHHPIIGDNEIKIG